jgi:CRP-like cAMP-binding protein
MVQSQTFLNFVNSAPGITSQEAEQILSCFKHLSLKNKEYFLREGEICKQIGYVHKGCLSYYRLMENGKQKRYSICF